MDKIWLSSPHMGTLEKELVEEAFTTNWISTVGPNIERFEQLISRFCEVTASVALSSGTAAIHLALIALNVRPGDVVLCQNLTFAATVNPVTYLGATPVLIGSEKDTWNMDPEALETALRKHGKKVAAIIPVHLYGMPANMRKIKELAQQYGVPVIEDAAEAMGSSIGIQPCGGMSEIGILSFNGNKIITTSGGGALLSNDKSLVERVRFLSTQARDPAPHYQHSQVGYNYRMSNVLAGIGIGQMNVLLERVKQRQQNYERYHHYFQQVNASGFGVQFQEAPIDYHSNRWLTCIYLDPEVNSGINSMQIMKVLAEQNIESRPIWKPMKLQPVFQECMYYGDRFEDKLFEKGLCLPSGSNLTTEDFNRIFDTLDQFFD